jgi:hypothetical protein
MQSRVKLSASATCALRKQLKHPFHFDTIAAQFTTSSRLHKRSKTPRTASPKSRPTIKTVSKRFPEFLNEIPLADLQLARALKKQFELERVKHISSPLMPTDLLAKLEKQTFDVSSMIINKCCMKIINALCSW